MQHESIRELNSLARTIASIELPVGIDMLSRALTVQREKFGSKSVVVANALVELASMHQRFRSIEEAEVLLREALEIMKLHDDCKSSFRLQVHYGEVLRELGRLADAEKFLTIHIGPSTNTQKRRSSHIRREARQFEEAGNLNKARELLENDYESAKSQAPYSMTSLKALEALAEHHIRCVDYLNAASSYALLVAMQDDGAQSSKADLLKHLLALADSHINCEQWDSAAPVISRAKELAWENQDRNWRWQNLLNFVRLEIAAQLFDEAALDLEAVEAICKKDPETLLRSYKALTELWQKLGKPERAQDIFKDYQPNPLKRIEVPRFSSFSADRRRAVIDRDNRKTYPDSESCRANLEGSILKSWSPPPQSFSYQLKVYFRYDENGYMRKLTPIQTSGYPDLDKIAILSIAKFGRLNSLLKNDLDLEFHFVYQPSPIGGTGTLRILMGQY